MVRDILEPRLCCAAKIERMLGDARKNASRYLQWIFCLTLLLLVHRGANFCSASGTSCCAFLIVFAIFSSDSNTALDHYQHQLEFNQCPITKLLSRLR
jgi:hypothetical protein